MPSATDRRIGRSVFGLEEDAQVPPATGVAIVNTEIHSDLKFLVPACLSGVRLSFFRFGFCYPDNGRRSMGSWCTGLQEGNGRNH